MHFAWFIWRNGPLCLPGSIPRRIKLLNKKSGLSVALLVCTLSGEAGLVFVYDLAFLGETDAVLTVDE